MSNITLTIPNDDHIALRAFGKALEEMALAHGAEPRKTVGELSYKLNIDTSEALERLNGATGELMQAAPHMLDELRFEGEELQGKRKEPEIDTTAQQVESLATIKPFEERLELLDKALSKETPESLAEKLQSYNLGPTTDPTGIPWDERIHSASKALNADGTWRLRRKPKDMDEAEWATFVETVKLELSHAMESFDEQVIMEEDSLQRPLCGIDPAHETIEPPVTPPGDDFHTDAGVVSEQTVAGIPPLPVPPPTDDWQSEVTHPETGDLCSVCMKPQFSSPSGVTCENGHGGAPAYEKPVPPPVVVAPPVPVQAALSEGIARYGDAMSELAKNDGNVQWDFPRLMTFLTERHGKIDVATVNTLLAQDGMSSVQELNAHPDKIGPFVARVKAHLGE